MSRTPGMELVFIGDIDVEAATEAALRSGHETRLVIDPTAIPEPREPR